MNDPQASIRVASSILGLALLLAALVTVALIFIHLIAISLYWAAWPEMTLLEVLESWREWWVVPRLNCRMAVVSWRVL